MEKELARTRRLILLTVFLIVIANLLFLRHNKQATAKQSKKNNDIIVNAQPGCVLDRDAYESHDLMEIVYRWQVAEKFQKPLKQYKVRVTFIDESGKLLFADDHYPPRSVMDWESGQAITYKRVVYIPLFESDKKATIVMELYDEFKPDRTILLAGSKGLTARIQVAALTLISPPNIEEKLQGTYVEYDEGWYAQESEPTKNRSWHWMADRATVNLPNLQTDAILFINIYVPRHPFEEPSTVTISLMDHTLDVFTADTEQLSRKYRIPWKWMEGLEYGQLLFETDQTYIPRKLGLSNDERELGLMVFTVFYRRQSQVQQELIMIKPQHP